MAKEKKEKRKIIHIVDQPGRCCENCGEKFSDPTYMDVYEDSNTFQFPPWMHDNREHHKYQCIRYLKSVIDAMQASMKKLEDAIANIRDTYQHQ